MSKIEQIISKTVDAIIAHKDTAYIGLIVNKLSDAREGIASLNITYADHPKIISAVNTQLANIDLQLINYRHLIKGYKDIETEMSSLKLDPKEEEIKLENDFFDGSSEKRKLRRKIKKSFDKLS